ncbi:MAG: hypothetical protein ACC707_14170 [Thiohalomonadales bacterium]
MNLSLQLGPIQLGKQFGLFRSLYIYIALIYLSVACANPVLAATVTGKLKTVTATYGSASVVNLSLPQWPKDSKLSLRPSGPTIIDSFQLSSPAIDFIHVNGLSYVLIDNRHIIAIEWGKKARLIAEYKTSNPISQLKQQGKFLLIAVDNHGLEWLDISSPKTIRRAAYFKIQGHLNTLAVADNRLAYSKHNSSIDMLSVDTNAKTGKLNVSRQNSIHVSNTINDLKLTNNRLYITSSQTGLTIFDIDPHKSATILGGFKTAGTALMMQLRDDNIFIADGSAGLTILDVKSPSDIVWRGSHNKIGTVNNVWLNDDLTIINNANLRLANLNIDKLDLPITDSLYKPRQAIIAVSLSGKNVFVATGKQIQKLDYFGSAVIQISQSGVNQGGSRRAFIENDIAYVADWFSGLHIYDIRLPRQPRHLGNYHSPGSSKGVVVQDGIAYIGDDDHGLQIVDVSDPRHPVKISELMTTGLAYTLKLVGQRIYLADHRGGFHIIDVSNVKKPTIIGSFDTPGKSWAIEVKDKFVFVADDLSGLLIFDVSDASHPRQVGQFDPGGYAEDVQVQDDIAYVSFFDKGLYLVDISNPQAPTEISHIQIPGNARSIDLQDDYAYIAAWESGLQIVDISRKKHLRHIAYVDTAGSTWGADIRGNYAYLWDWWGGIKVADIRNARDPVLIGRYQGRGRIQQLTKVGNTAFSANGSHGMQVFDITNPLNPIWMSGLDLSGFASDIITHKDSAYVALADTGIATINISDPFSPRWISKLRTSGSSEHIGYHNGYVYVSQKPSGIDVIDVRNESRLQPMGRIAIEARDLLTTDNLLVVAQRKGINVYTLDEPATPEIIQTLPLSKPAQHLSAQNDMLALVYGEKNVQLYRESNKGLQFQYAFQHHEDINDILIDKGKLFIYSNNGGLVVEDIATLLAPTNQLTRTPPATTARPIMASHYPSTGIYQSMLIHKNTILFSGQPSIASLEILPRIDWQRQVSNQLQLALPKDLPLGNYHIEIELASGQTLLYPNLLEVILGKSKKPQISMEEFKKLLKAYTNKPSPASKKD